MVRIVLFFILFISLMLPVKQLTAHPSQLAQLAPKEIVKLLVRLIREDSRELFYNRTLRSRMNGVATSRRWPERESLAYADEIAKSFASFESGKSGIPFFLNDAFDSVISNLPKDEALWRSTVVERLGIPISETEYKQIESILRMTKGEREALFQSAVVPMIKNWRSHFEAPVIMAGEWKGATTELNESLASLIFPFDRDSYRHIEWRYLHGTEELGIKIVDPSAAVSRFKLIQCRGEIQNIFLIVEQNRHFPVNHLPTHLQITGMEETARVIEFVPFQKGFTSQGRTPQGRTPQGHELNGLIASFSVLPHEHRFMTLSYLRGNTSFSEAVIVDLWSGKVYSGWHGEGEWLNVMRDPMTDLFRQELVRLKSPLSQLLNESLLKFKQLGWNDIDDFLEMELTLLGDGKIRYRLARFNFEAGSFERNSPVITLIMDMKNLSQPKVIQMNVESTGTRLLPRF